MSGARSKNACHTCRIRKKKCDEQRPICLNCSSRAIPCYGYENAPTWLGAIRGEAEVLRSLKHAAEDRYKAKRRRWWTDLGNSAPPAQLGAGASGARDWSAWESDAWEASPTAQEETRGEQSRVERHAASSPSSSPWNSTALILRQHSRPDERSDVAPHPQGSHVGASPVRNSLWWDGGLANSYSIRNRQELGLLMNYLDNVFVLQFGFYQLAAADTGRGWLLGSLLKSKALYTASLGLSAHHQVLVRQRSLNQAMAFSSDVNHLYATTLKNLYQQLALWKDLSGNELLMTGFEVLGSMNQMLSLEIFRELGGHWEVHLKAARDFLLMIGSGSVTSKSSKHSSQRPSKLENLERILRDPNSPSLPSSDITALKFFVLSFIWVDILSYATGLSSFDAKFIDYTHLLHDGTLELNKLMGCHNWVMISLLKIAKLEHWKRTTDSSDIFTLRSFRDQAIRLHCSLETGIANLLSTRTALAHLELDSNLVTEMFALAALAYLQVVVTGAYPQVPEIRVRISRALTALTILPNRLLIRISWPFCIIACMSLPDQEASIRRIVQAAMATGPIGTVWKGLKIAEECWRLRKVRDGEAVGWKETMKSLGVSVLLV